MAVIATSTRRVKTTSSSARRATRSAARSGGRSVEADEDPSTRRAEGDASDATRCETTGGATKEKTRKKPVLVAESLRAVRRRNQKNTATITGDLLAPLNLSGGSREIQKGEVPLHRANTKEFIARLLSPTQSTSFLSGETREFIGPPGAGTEGQGGQLAIQDQLFKAKKRLNAALGAIETQKSIEMEEEGLMALPPLTKKRKRGKDAERTSTRSASLKASSSSETTTKNSKKEKEAVKAAEQQQPVQGKEKRSSTRKGVFGAIAASGDKLSTSKPKRADRRRTIARFTTAILRAEGSHVFISRDGLGYRKAFDKFLAQTYGKTFDVNGYWWTNARVEPFLRLLVHIASEGKINISEKDASMLFKKKDERQAAEWVLDEEKLAKCANGMNAKDLAAIFEGKPRKTKNGFVRGTPLLVPTDKETLPVDVEAVKKAEEENKLIMENRLKVRSEKRAAAAAGLNTKTTRSTNSKEKHTKATAKKAAKAPTNANAGSVLTDDALPGRSRSPNFFQQLTSQKSLNATMMQPPSPKGSIPPHQGFRATPSVTPPPEVTRLFQNVQGFGAGGSNASSNNSLLMLGSRPGSRQGAIAAAGVARQYSSDLSRMMSEFNNDPESSNLFLSSYNALSASELDAVAATMSTNPALKRGMSRRQASTIIGNTTQNKAANNK